VGIFASIAAETDINKYATPAFKSASPAFVAYDDVNERYYAGIGELWTRAESATSWTKASTNGLPGTGPYFATSGAVVGAFLYATIADTSTGKMLGVFSWNGTIWSRVDATFPIDPGPEKLRSVMAANDILFAVTATETIVNSVVTDTNHSLYFLDTLPNPDVFASTGIANADIGLPNAVAWDLTNSRFWFTAGNSVLSGTTASAITINGAAPTALFGGLAYVASASPIVVFTTRTGTLYEVDNTTWSAASAVFKNPRELTYSFGIPAYIDDVVNEILLVPGQNYPTAAETPAKGYLEFDAAGFSAASATKTDYGLAADINNYFITLDAKSVKQIVAFEEAPGTRYRLFALTNGDGLWSNQFTGGSWSGWRRE
jgi:hypothetical protein